MAQKKLSAMTITQVAVALAVLTTVIAMVASGSIVVSGGRSFEEGVHSVALGFMLAAYVFLILVIMVFKKTPPEPLCVVDQDGFLSVSPCDREGFIVLDQVSIRCAFQNIERQRLPAVRIVVARLLTIPDDFLDSLSFLPNLTLLDVQGATVSKDFWNRLEDLPSISHVLATNAISKELLRDVSISLPEIKFWLGQERKLVIGSKAAMNPTGSCYNES